MRKVPFTDKQKAQMAKKVPAEFRDEISIVIGECDALHMAQKIQQRSKAKAEAGDVTPLFINLFKNFGDEKPLKTLKLHCFEVNEDGSAIEE